MEESHCGAHIQVDALPLSAALKQACLLYDWQAEELALTAGEDYCLLMTINPQAFPSLQAAYLQRFQRPLFPFGTILASPQLEYTFHGNLFISQKNGFDHFKS
jgi:thiamine-monophosphate kinase